MLNVYTDTKITSRIIAVYLSNGVIFQIEKGTFNYDDLTDNIDALLHGKKNRVNFYLSSLIAVEYEQYEQAELPSLINDSLLKKY